MATDYYNENKTTEDKIFNLLFDTSTDELLQICNAYDQLRNKKINDYLNSLDEDDTYIFIRENYFDEIIEYIIRQQESFGNELIKRILDDGK